MRLPPDLLAPRYGGSSIADVPGTVERALTGRSARPLLASDALPPEALRDVERIVLLVVDGLGAHQLARVAADGAAPALAGFRSARLTTVAPSSTATALTSLATGLAPRAHGVLGYRMHLPSFGLTANMIGMRGVLGGPLEAAGLDPTTLVPQPTLYESLAAAGVRVDAVTRAAFLDGALTRLIYRGVAPAGFVNAPDLFVAARRTLAAQRGARGFLRLYYDALDSVAHAFGPASAEHDAEVAALDATLDRELLRRVEDPGALLLVTADHGHVAIPAERVVRFADHPDLLDCLVLPPTGEGRFAYLHVRPDRVDAARKHIESAWPEDALVVPVREAADAGLFGPGPEHPEFARRAGDLLLLARGDRRFVTEYGLRRPGWHLGSHGGLSADEMLVPLLWRRLG